MMSISMLAFAILTSLMLPNVLFGQCAAESAACAQPVPHLVKITGTLKETVSSARPGVISIKFSIYADAAGVTPLWQEVQNIAVDSQGRYEVMLGATANEGIPVDLFNSGEPRWLGVQAVLPGSEEQHRVLLVSVPYALRAGDAETLGGLPASAFARTSAAAGIASTPANLAIPTTGTSGVGSAAAKDGTSTSAAKNTDTAVVATSPLAAVAGTTDTIPKYSTATTFVNSQITDVQGVVSMQNLSNVLFADRFSGGVPAAIAACPANGCVISAISPQTNLNLGSIDPGTKAVTIYLGPYTYTVTQITLRKSLKLLGMGASGGTNGSPTCSVALPCNGTALQSANGNNPVIILPQTNSQPATNVTLSGFRILGAPGNTNEDAIFLDTSSSVNTGLWYSAVDDVAILGFAGIPVHIKGRLNDFQSATQWVTFNNVAAFRTPGGKNALRIEGAAFELRFVNCQFDGAAIGDGTNIYLGGLAGGRNGYPASIVFEGLVTQLAAVGVQVDGALNMSFRNSHHENLFGAYQITNANNIGTQGLSITDCYFSADTAVNGGAGYALNVGTTFAYNIAFTHNQIFGNPDSIVKGTNLASVTYQDNLYLGPQNSPPTSGITTQMTPAPSINILGIHTIGLNPSKTPITTIQSSLGPGETVTFYALSGYSVFSSGGNIDLFGQSAIFVSGSVTFVRTDLDGPKWKVVSQWNPTF